MKSGFNPMTSIQQGSNFMQDIIDQRRKTRAYKALRATYGDVAGDPDAALKLQTYEHNKKLYGQQSGAIH